MSVHAYHFLLLTPVRNLVQKETFQHTITCNQLFEISHCETYQLFLLIDRLC